MYKAFRNVLLAYDDSDGSKKALQEATEMLINNPNMNLVVVTVYEEKIENKQMEFLDRKIENATMHGYLLEGIQVPPMSISDEQDKPATHTIISNSVEKSMNMVKSHFKNLQDRNIRLEVLEGNPAESICEYAATEGTELIIIGNSGKSGLKKIFIGNVTEQVLKHAPCSVLIAK